VLTSLPETTRPVLRALRHGPLNRAQLGSITGWSRNTVAARLEELQKGGWVTEVDFGSGERGRPYVRYRVVPEAALVYVASLGWHQLHGAICGLDAQPLAVDVHDHALDDLPAAIDVVHQQLSRLTADPAVHGRGVLAGVVGAPSPLANQIDMAAWSRAGSLDDQFSSGLGVPTVVDNDANLMALGLAREFPDLRTFLFVKVATGIGSGIVIDGKLHSGVAGLAGEIGHIPVHHGTERQCACGNRGCLGLVASVPGVLRMLSAGPRKIENLDELAALVTAGDGEAVATLRTAGRDIGEALVGVITAIAPERIFLGGRLTQFGDHLATGVRESITRLALPALSARVRVQAVAHHQLFGLRGAADLAFDRLLAV
jgi:predicted NBD/HSP70 family sugar kinase